jgi:hypothetical protein
MFAGGGARGCVVEGNLIRNVSGGGIFVGSFNTESEYTNALNNPTLHDAIDAVVRNNVRYLNPPSIDPLPLHRQIVDGSDGAGVAFYSALNALVEFNTLVNVARTMHAGVLFNLSPKFFNRLSQTLPPNVNITFRSNIVSLHPLSAAPALEARVMAAVTTPFRSATLPASTNCSAATAPRAAARVWTKADNGGRCPFFPPWHAMNQNVSDLPRHAMSDEWVRSIGAMPECQCRRPTSGANCVRTAVKCGFLHPDFGIPVTNPFNVTSIAGIPITRIPSNTPRVNITFFYADESDAGPYPLPPTALIEGTPDASSSATSSHCDIDKCPGDRHVLLLDDARCELWELWRAEPVVVNGSVISWRAGSGARFNLTSDALRPLGFTSADAAGLSVAAGLVR